MPRVPKSEISTADLYGMTKVDNSLSFRDRMRKKWRPTDTVRVRNVTNQSCEWQWLDDLDETYTIEDDTNIKIVDRDEPGLWRLGAGEPDVLIGACAYMFVETLFKQVCVLKTGIVINPLSEREIRNFSMDDPEKQEQFINAVFEGKMGPQDMQMAALANIAGDSAPKVSQTLPGLTTEREELAKRNAAQRSMMSPATAPTEHRDLADLAGEFDEGATLLGTATGGLPSDDHRPVPQPEAKEEVKAEKTPKTVSKKTAAPVA